MIGLGESQVLLAERLDWAGWRGHGEAIFNPNISEREKMNELVPQGVGMAC